MPISFGQMTNERVSLSFRSYLAVVFVENGNAVHLDDAIVDPQPGGLRRRVGVHIADEVTALVLGGHQVEAESCSVVSFNDVTQPRRRSVLTTTIAPIIINYQALFNTFSFRVRLRYVTLRYVSLS